MRSRNGDVGRLVQLDDRWAQAGSAKRASPCENSSASQAEAGVVARGDEFSSLLAAESSTAPESALPSSQPASRPPPDASPKTPPKQLSITTRARRSLPLTSAYRASRNNAGDSRPPRPASPSEALVAPMAPSPPCRRDRHTKLLSALGFSTAGVLADACPNGTSISSGAVSWRP